MLLFWHPRLVAWNYRLSRSSSRGGAFSVSTRHRGGHLTGWELD
jgi:hypothetical protein